MFVVKDLYRVIREVVASEVDCLLNTYLFCEPYYCIYRYSHHQSDESIEPEDFQK
jgi:hypothetical protein